MHSPVCSLVTLAGHLHPGTALEKEPVSRKQACTVGRKKVTWDPKEDLQAFVFRRHVALQSISLGLANSVANPNAMGGGRYNITGIRKGMI